MKRVALTHDELDLVLEHRRKKTVYNEALVHIEHKLLEAIASRGMLDGAAVTAIIAGEKAK